jgi:hypothetical protein
VTELDDLARCGALDDEALLVAALACPFCGNRPAHVLVNHRDAVAEAMCACGHCDLQWSIALDADQALRLLLAPPRGLWLQHHPARPDR